MGSNKELKKFLLKILNEIKSNTETKPAPTIRPITKPTTTPAPGKKRKLVPDKWPETAPGPKPKAEGEEIGIEEIAKEMKLAEEITRMKDLISEGKQIKQEMSMNIEDPEYDEPHPSVRRGIEGDKPTPFSDSEFFGGGELDYSTLEKIGSEEFNKIIRDVKPFGKMNMGDFQQAFQLMSSIEMPNKDALEALAIRKVKEQFGLPDEVSNQLEAKLVRTVNKPSEDTDNLTKEVVKDLQFTDEEKEIIRQHVEKRRLQNLMLMGSGFRSHSTFNSIKGDLDAIDPRLHPLYEKTMPNVALFMWKTPLEDIMGGVQMMGLSKLKKNANGEVRAESQATIFPILLHETAKAAIELLFAIYLITLTERFGANVAGEIIKQADVFEEEIWHKRIGPTLWRYLHDAIDYVIVHEKERNYTLVSYLLHDISMMEPPEFLIFLNSVVYDGQKAIATITNMANDIERDLASEEAAPAGTDTENLEDNISDVSGELIQLAKGAKEKKEATPSKPINFEDMSIEQLQGELKSAVSEERYEDASKIVKAIGAKAK